MVDSFRSADGLAARSRRLVSFLRSTDSAGLESPPGSGLYKLDAIPLLLDSLGVHMGCDEWAAVQQLARQDAAPVSPTALPGAPQAAQPSAAGSSDVVVVALAEAEAEGPLVATGERYEHTQTLAQVSRSPADYAGLSQAECVVLLRARDKQLAKEKARTAAASKRARNYYHVCRALRTKIARHEGALRASGSASAANVPFQLDRSCGKRGETRQGRYLTPNGSVAVAIRRNFGNAAGEHFGQMLLDDVSRHTVHRCEVKAAAALMAASRAFYAPIWASLSDDTDFNLTVHGFRSDATNSGIWQRQKLCALELETAYLEELPASRSFEWDWQFMFSCQKRVSDLLPVGDGSGPGAIGMLLKTMSALGCPTWQDLLAQASAGQPARGAHWYCFTSDCGADQVAAKKALHVTLKDAPTIIFVGMDCLEHQAHLIGLGALKLIDAALKCHGRKWKYFASLAKVSNVWRDTSPAIYREWTYQHGLESSQAHACKLIPKCCAGRWQNVETQEKLLNAAGKEKLTPVFLAVFSKHSQKRKHCEDADGVETEAITATVDELAVEESHAYSEKLGRWRRDALGVLQDCLFWKIIYMMTLIRPPCSHLSYFLKSQSSSEVATAGGHLACLATGKAESIAAEFNEILTSSSWQSLCVGLGAEDACWLTNLAGQLTIFHAGAFDRRVVQKVLQFPFKLFHLITSQPQIKCVQRQAVARELLAAPGCELDVSTRKIRSFYGEDLRVAATSGYCGLRLWVSLKAAARVAKADVRENERINKMITLLSDRCPNSSLELMSSRVCLKHCLGVDAGPKQLKWSALRPVAAALHQTCLSHWHEIEEVQNEGRFSAPTAPDSVPGKDVISAEYPKLMPSKHPQHTLAWAACYNLLWYRESKKDKAAGRLSAVTFGKLAEGQAAYVCADKSYSTGRFLMCELKLETGMLNVRLPMRFTSSLDLFASWHDHVHGGSAGPRKVYVRKIPYAWEIGESGLQMRAECHAAAVMFKLSEVARLPQPQVQRAVQRDAAVGAAEAPGGGPARSCPEAGGVGGSRSLEEVLEQVVDSSSLDAELLESAEVRKLTEAMLEEVTGFCDGDDQDHAQTAKLEAEELCESAVRRREQELIANALQRGADLDSNNMKLAVDKLLEDHPGMLREDAFVETALNSDRVLGSVSYESYEAAALEPRVQDASEAYPCWEEAASYGISVLVDRAQACATREVGELGQLSMVACVAEGEGSAVVLVSWASASQRRGRIASLDNENRVKWTMPVGANREPLDFSSSQIVHPAIGVRMVRLRGPKGALRPHLSADMTRLLAMWRTAQSSRDQELLEASALSAMCADACKYCDLRSGAVTTCAICLLPWHRACSEKLANANTALIGNLPPVELELPEEFADEPGGPARSPLAA